MNKRHQILVVLVILICWWFDQPSALAQNTDPNNEIFNRIKNCVMLLDDGQTQSYGLYLARTKNKKFMYVLAASQLAIGIDGKIRITLLNGKKENFKAKRLSANDALQVAIYEIASPPKPLRPITLLPPKEAKRNLSLWTLSRPESEPRTLRIRLVKPTANLANAFAGSPIFDAKGRVIGSVMSNAQLVPIAKSLGYATKTLHGLDLNPIWREVYPTQFIVEQVKESVALLDTKKNGAGIFLGLDKKKNGYVLTAAHVVEGETGLFTVQFTQHRDEKTVGEAMTETIEKDLDLAIVKIRNCPKIKPVTFMRTDSVKKIERYFVKQAGAAIEYTVASIGYDDNLFWRQNFGKLVSITDKTFEADLPLQHGDSGGPTFNEKGEILGLNLKITGAKSGKESVSTNSREILRYLNDKLGQVDFEVKWDFHDYPSFWRKNRLWILPVGTASVAGLAAVFLKPEADLPIEPLTPVPGVPPGNP